MPAQLKRAPSRKRTQYLSPLLPPEPPEPLPPVRRFNDFTARVLRLIAEDSPVGFVRLSTQVWPTQVPTDWWMLLEAVVRNLNDEGLVTFRVGAYPHGGEEASYGGREEILECRINQEGLLAAGFPVRRVDIGRRNLAHLPHDYVRPAKGAVWVDWTRYWHHPFHAIGGPIERQSLRLHRIMYPDHRHGDDRNEQGGTMVMTHEPEPTQPPTPPKQKRGVAVEPARVDEARRLLAEGRSYKEAAAAIGISVYTLYGLIPVGKESSRRAAQTRNANRAEAALAPAAPPPAPEPVPAYGTKEVIEIAISDVSRLSPEAETFVVAGQIQADSLKSRMLKAIAATGPYQTTDALMNVVRRPGDNFGAHEFYHLLHSLNKGGLITFVLGRGGRNGTKRAPGASKPTATNIKATNAGYRAAGFGSTMDFTTKGGAHPVRKTSDATDPRNQPTVAAGGPIERTHVLHLHDHDLAVWRSTCRACMVYHTTGKPHEVVEAVAIVAQNERLVLDPMNVEAPIATATDEATDGPFGDPALEGENGHPVYAATPAPEPTYADELVISVEEQAEVNQRELEAGYPLLVALREREAARVVASRRSARYLEAAALLEEVDPEESQRILGLATAAEGEPLTNLEAEYLAFAAEARGG